jgi:hypothetical protein
VAQKVQFDISFVDKFSRIGAKLKKSTEKATTAVNKFNMSSGRMARGLAKVGRAAKKVGTKLKGMGLAAKAAAIGALYAIGRIAAATISAAADAEEMKSKLQAVFQDNTSDMNKWADSFADNANRSSLDMRTMAGDVGAILSGMGLENNALASTSQQIVELSEDVGSFFNVESTDALAAFQSALAGSYEPMRKFGVLLNKEKILKQAMLMTGIRRKKDITEEHQAMAMLALTQEKLNKQGAIGDAIRTSASFTNQMKGMKGQLKQASAAIGKELLPMLVPLVGALTSVFRLVAEASPKWIKFGVIAVAVGAGLATLLVVGLAVAGVFSFIGGVFGVATVVVAGTVATFLGLAAIVGGLIVLAYAFNEEIGEWLNLDNVFAYWIPVFEKLWDWWSKIALAIGDFVGGPILDGVLSFANSLGGFFESLVTVGINVNDPGGNVKSVETEGAGSTTFNQGQSMAQTG